MAKQETTEVLTIAQQGALINGEWVAGEGDTLISNNPVTHAVIWSGKTTSALQVDKAFLAAHAAFLTWSLTTVETRVEILKKYQALLKAHQAQLADDIMQETGKTHWESLAEVNSMIGKVDLSIAAYHKRSETREEGNAWLTHRPHGVCAVFGPYNFPGHLPNGHIVPALLAGNTIVFKPSEQSILVGARMLMLLHAAGVPKGVVNLVPGELKTAKAIVKHPLLAGFFFTGSSQVGRQIHEQFAGRPEIILALEMGGNNPLIVENDVLASPEKRRAAVYHTIQSAFVSAGQRCTCARRLLVPNGALGDAFLADLVQVAKHLQIDKPDAQPQPFYASVVSSDAAQALLKAQEKLLALGAKPLLLMEQLSDSAPLLSPAILDVTGIETPDEEYFGPILKVYRTDSLTQAIAWANQTQYGLSAGILTDDEQAWRQFYAHIRAGVVNRNQALTGASGAAPFGGVGLSGNHRPSAYYAADYCAYPVASLVNTALETPQAQSPGITLEGLI